MLSQPSSSGVAPVTPQMIQQMIIHAFSALGISGKNSSLSSLWYIDSGASNNHMTFSSSNLSNIQTYDNKHQVHTADGEKLSITAIGDASNPLPLKNVLLSPGLSTRFVGQLIDNHCNVSFPSSGVMVQDPMSINIEYVHVGM